MPFNFAFLEKNNIEQPPQNLHFFHTEYCIICTRCSSCSGFGPDCVRVAGVDRSQDRGMPCGCGKGHSGCRNCGACQKCAAQSPCAFTQGNKISSQWRKVGGTKYSGTIAKVNDDGTYDIKYDDGDEDKQVQQSRVSLRTSGSSVADRASHFRFSSGASLFESHLDRMARELRGIFSSFPITCSFSLSMTSRGPYFTTEIVTTGPTTGIMSRSLRETEGVGNMPLLTIAGHKGMMRCGCAHGLGRLPYPLSPSHVHQSGSCSWECCGAPWNTSGPCPEVLLDVAAARASASGRRAGVRGAGVGAGGGGGGDAPLLPRKRTLIQVATPEEVFDDLAHEAVVDSVDL